MGSSTALSEAADPVGADRGDAADALRALVPAALAGARAAMRALLESLAPVIVRACRRVMGRVHPDVEDVRPMGASSWSCAASAAAKGGSYPACAALLRARALSLHLPAADVAVFHRASARLRAVPLPWRDPMPFEPVVARGASCSSWRRAERWTYRGHDRR